MIVRLDELRDADGALTHKMCCMCFALVPVGGLWQDQAGQRWDLCSKRCASDAGCE